MGAGDDFLRLHGTMAGSFSVGSKGRAADCAVLDLASTTGGLLFPRMTEANRLAISSPEDGLIVFDTTYKELYLYTRGAWLTTGSGTGFLFPADTSGTLTGYSAYIAPDGKAYETDARYPSLARFAGVDIGLPTLLQGSGPVLARFSSASSTPIPGQVVYLSRGDAEGAGDLARGKLTVNPPLGMIYAVGLVLSVPANYATEFKATVVLQPSAACGLFDLVCPDKPDATLTWVGGILTQVDYSDGRTKTFTYNGSGQLYRVICDKRSGMGQRQVDITYNPDGTVATIARTDI